MAVTINYDSSGTASNDCVRVGLINNMPDEALKATERQYVSLLGAASHGFQVDLSIYTLPGIPRSEASQRHIASIYSNIDDLWDGQLDGLIVTGREPLAADLEHEPYWDSFTRTLEWAREQAHATIWSCLAAHAAVLHMDGIRRARRSDKLFGIYRCKGMNDHPLMAKAPMHLELPHSRWNSLPLEQVAEAGYSVLTRTSEKEVDTFVKQEKKLFVFFQGHPEYESDTLLREYRRDIGRYFKSETSRYPLVPENYFSYATQAMLHDLEKQYASSRQNELPPAVSKALSDIRVDNTWRESAVSLYENWLRHIRLQKNMTMRAKSATALPHAAAARTQALSLTHQSKLEVRLAPAQTTASGSG
jgi:homoserine O-succinyltransferase